MTLRFRQCCTLVLAFILIIFSLVCVGGNTADATPTYASNVIQDLSIDLDFNVNNYPVLIYNAAQDDEDQTLKSKVYGLEVIQIAEGSEGSLLIYVYQPSGKVIDLRATTIRIGSMSAQSGELKVHDYKLKYINSSGAIYKYSVTGFALPHTAVRNYSIIAIHRLFNALYDTDTGNDTTKDEVVYKVAQRWTAATVGDKVIYHCAQEKTIEIIDRYDGFVRYRKGFYLFHADYTDSHYVAFTTDLPIEKIYEADVEFWAEDYEESHYAYGTGQVGGSMLSYGKHFESITIKGTEKGNSGVGGWAQKKYEWDRIQTVQQFKDEVTSSEGVIQFTDTALPNIDRQQFVFRFYETPYNYTPVAPNGEIIEYSRVTNLTILRLKFLLAGRVFNVGVIDEKRSEGNLPSNTNTDELDPEYNFWSWLSDFFRITFGALPWWVWLIVATIVLGIIITPLFVMAANGSENNKSKIAKSKKSK